MADSCLSHRNIFVQRGEPAQKAANARTHFRRSRSLARMSAFGSQSGRSLRLVGASREGTIAKFFYHHITKTR